MQRKLNIFSCFHVTIPTQFLKSSSLSAGKVDIDYCGCLGVGLFQVRIPGWSLFTVNEKNPLIIYQKFFRPLNFSQKIFRPLKFLEEILAPLSVFCIPSFFNRLIFTSLTFISLEHIFCEEIFVCEEMKSLISTAQLHSSLAFHTNFQTP